jgi:hypothetical protein
MSEVPADKVIAAFVMLRDKRSELKQEFEKVDKELEEKQQKCKIFLMRAMQAIGTTQLKGGDGTAYMEDEVKFSAADWPVIWAWIKEHNRFDMLEKRLGAKALKEFLDETGELPPAINMFAEKKITIRRS